jgi:hypothetical protein
MAAAKTYKKPELEELWVKAGGPTAEAKTAAAIALAESGGNPNAKNPEGPEHAEGLWQIKGQDVAGNPFNPEVSAANAVAKYKAAKGFSPWTTYTSGAYKQYEGENYSSVAPIRWTEELGKTLFGNLGESKEGLGPEINSGVSEVISGVSSTVDAPAEFISAITNPNTWLRIAEGIGGATLFFVGLKTLTRGSGGGVLQEGQRQSKLIGGVGVKAGKVIAGVAK